MRTEGTLTCRGMPFGGGGGGGQPLETKVCVCLAVNGLDSGPRWGNLTGFRDFQVSGLLRPSWDGILGVTDCDGKVIKSV